MIVEIRDRRSDGAKETKSNFSQEEAALTILSPDCSTVISID